jgi:hypothetical protein
MPKLISADHLNNIFMAQIFIPNVCQYLFKSEKLKHLYLNILRICIQSAGVAGVNRVADK